MLKLNKNFWKNKKVLVTATQAYRNLDSTYSTIIRIGIYGVSLHKNINSSIFKSNAKIKQSYFDLVTTIKLKD